MVEFIEEVKNDEWEVLTDDGWKDFKGIGKTVEYDTYNVETSRGKTLECADDHLLIDETQNQTCVKDLRKGSKVFTIDGIEDISEVSSVNRREHMYDLLDVEGSLYYTNNFLSHNSTSFAVFVCHYILFNKYKNVAILANKEKHSKELLRRIKVAYQELPYWLQVDVVQWSKMSITLSNGCTVTASSTSSDSIRGDTINGVLIVDELAFIPNNIWSDFFNSVYPSISAAKQSKIIFVSTPFGFNQFYSIWSKAKAHQNSFNPIEIDWWDVPTYAKTDRTGYEYEYETGDTVYDFRNIETGQEFSSALSDMEVTMTLQKENKKFEVLIEDEWEDFYGILKHHKWGDSRFYYDIVFKEWYHETINNIGVRRFDQEYKCSFLASTDSLVTNDVIENMVFEDVVEFHRIPFYNDLVKINEIFEKSINIYKLPEEGHEYSIGVDPAQITQESSGDSVAIQILDVTDLPFEQVGTIIINEGVHYSELPAVIKVLGYAYNEALVFIENNDTVGVEIADSLLLDFEYDHVFSEKPGVSGFRTTARKKKLGCLNLKMLIETQKLKINDVDTISQLSTFVKRKNSYESEPGYRDDAVMAMIHSLVFLQDRMGYEHKRHLVDGIIDPEPVNTSRANKERVRNLNSANEETDEDYEPMPFGFNTVTFDDTNIF